MDADFWIATSSLHAFHHHWDDDV